MALLLGLPRMFTLIHHNSGATSQTITQTLYPPSVTLPPFNTQPDAMAESVQQGPHIPEIENFVPTQVKLMTYKIDTCFLAWHSSLRLFGSR